MNIPQAILCVSNHHVYFRINGLPPQLFYRYLHMLKKRLPHMRWDKRIGMWQLPIWDLKILYEMCRLLFGVNNVLFRYQTYTSKSLLVQPRLPGLEEE